MSSSSLSLSPSLSLIPFVENNQLRPKSRTPIIEIPLSFDMTISSISAVGVVDDDDVDNGEVAVVVTTIKNQNKKESNALSLTCEIVLLMTRRRLTGTSTPSSNVCWIDDITCRIVDGVDTIVGGLVHGWCCCCCSFFISRRFPYK